MAFGWALPGRSRQIGAHHLSLGCRDWHWVLFEQAGAFRGSQGIADVRFICWAGAIGNIIDSAVYGQLFTAKLMGHDGRLGRKSEGYAPFLMGNVVDMFHFIVRWPASFPIESLAGREVFPPIWNLADAAISCGVIAILIGQRRLLSRSAVKCRARRRAE